MIKYFKKPDNPMLLVEKVRKESSISDFNDAIELYNSLSREIYIDVINPKVADNIDKIIRF